MDETQLLPCTQALLGDSCDNEKEPFLNGWLEVAGRKHDLVLGENKIGRDPGACQVLLQNAPGVSKEHAVLEIEGGCATLLDLASRNKTRIEKLVLRPHVRYGLRGGEKLLFGNVSAVYMTTDNAPLSGAASKGHEAVKEGDGKLCSSSRPTSSLGSTPAISLSPNMAEDLGGSDPLQKNGCAKTNQTEECQAHSDDFSLKKTDIPSDISDVHSTTSKANPSFEMLASDNSPPSAPMLELKRSNSCSPFRKGTPVSKYSRKCFFMPSQTKTVVEESDEEVHSDASREDDDFDDSIISPTPRPACSATLSAGPVRNSQSTASSLTSTPVASRRLEDKFAPIPETPCTPPGRGTAPGGASAVPDSHGPPSRRSAPADQKPRTSTSLIGSHSDADDVECYNSDASTDVENELEDAKEENATAEPKKKNSKGTKRSSSAEGVDKKVNINVSDDNDVTGNLHEELTQAFSGKICLDSENKNINFTDDVPIATQDVLEAFGEVARNSSEISLNIADETSDIFSILEESPQSSGKVGDDPFKKPFSTPATGRKSGKNVRETSLDNSILTQDILDKFDSPTQVVTGKSPHPSLGTCPDPDDEFSLAPTQLYVCDAEDTSEMPTQKMVPDDDPTEDLDSISDMCTQVYRENIEGNIAQKQGMMTPATRSRVVGETAHDNLKSPAFKASNLTEAESPSCLPTQIYNETLDSPRRVLNESISDMATQPYHSDLDVNKNDSPRPPADLNAELNISELATQPFVAHGSNKTPQRMSEFSINLGKPSSVDVEKETDESLSEMATQPYVADSGDEALESGSAVPCGVSPKSAVNGKPCGDDLSDMATQPYFESVPVKNTCDFDKNNEMSTDPEIPSDFEESISNIATQLYVDGNAEHNKPVDVDATQLFPPLECAGSSKPTVEITGDNLAADESHDANYDAPTQDLLNGGHEASPFLGQEDYDLPTQIIPTDGIDSAGEIGDRCEEVSARDDGTLTPTLEVPLTSGSFHHVSNNNNATLDTIDNRVVTNQTPLKLPEKNVDIELTPSLNPFIQKTDADSGTQDPLSVNCTEFNEDQDTDSCNSSVLSDTMLACMPDEVDGTKYPDLNPEEALTMRSTSAVPIIRTSESRSPAPGHGETGGVLASDSESRTSDAKTSIPDAKRRTPEAEAHDDSKASDDSKTPDVSKPPDDSKASDGKTPDGKTPDGKTPEGKTPTLNARTLTPDAKTSPLIGSTSVRNENTPGSDVPVEKRSPLTETASPNVETNSDVGTARGPQVTRSDGSVNRAEHIVPVNSFQFGSNQYDVGNSDNDDTASNESIETLNFVSDSESGSQSGLVFTPLKDSLQSVSTPGSSVETRSINMKTPSKISKGESVLPSRSQRSPRQSTLRKKKKKNCSEKLQDICLISSESDSELDASSQALFSINIDKITALKLSDHSFRSASSSDHRSPVIPVSEIPESVAVRNAEKAVKEPSSSTVGNTVEVASKPKCSSANSDGTGIGSTHNHSELSTTIAVFVSSDSGNDTPKANKNIEKSTKTSREAARASKKKYPDTSIKTRVKSLRNKTHCVDQTRGAATEETLVDPCVSAKKTSSREHLEPATAGPSGSCGVIKRHTASTEKSERNLTPPEISPASVQKQVSVHSGSVRVRSGVKGEEVDLRSVRSTRSGRAQRCPSRYSPDQKSSHDGGADKETNQNMRSTTARKRGRPSKGTTKRLKNLNAADFPIDEESDTNNSLTENTDRFIGDSAEANVLTENPCSSSRLSSNIEPESVSSTSKTDAKSESHPSGEISSSNEAGVNMEMDSEATVSSTTDIPTGDGGLQAPPKNRVSIETSTPSKSLLPTRNTRSRASLALPSSRVKTRQRNSVLNSVSEMSTVDESNGSSQQPVTSLTDVHVLDDVEDEITFRKSEPLRKSTRFSSRSSSRNSALKREAVEDSMSVQEAGARSSGNKRMKMGQSSQPSSSVPSQPSSSVPSQPSSSVPSQPLELSTVLESSFSSASANRGSRKSSRRTLVDSRLIVHSQSTEPDSAIASTAASTSKKTKGEENRTAAQAQNSQASSFLVPVNATTKRNLRKSQDSRTVQPSQESMTSFNVETLDLTGENSRSRRQTRGNADEISLSSKPSRGRGRPRKSQNQKPPAAENEDMDSSVLSVESFASSVGRRHQNGTTSVRSSVTSESHYLENSLLSSPSERQSKANTKPRVLFTGIVPEADDLRMLKRLGGVVVDSATQCSVLVSASAKRTCKLLACVARGVPVVTPAWLAASAAAAAFTDPWAYVVKDAQMEKKYGFDLRKSLLKARHRQLFEGLSIHATPGVLPQPDDMRDLVICGGGEYLERPPRSFYDRVVVVSCEQDRKLWPPLRKLNIPLVSTEFILTGILRSEVCVDSNRL